MEATFFSSNPYFLYRTSIYRTTVCWKVSFFINLNLQRPKNNMSGQESLFVQIKAYKMAQKNRLDVKNESFWTFFVKMMKYDKGETSMKSKWFGWVIRSFINEMVSYSLLKSWIPIFSTCHFSNIKNQYSKYQFFPKARWDL